ncbi:hypothetical protein WDW86_05195 [Bdellovibrionota bacterium FG-2]
MQNNNVWLKGKIAAFAALVCVVSLGAVNGCSKTVAVPDPAASASPSPSPSPSPSASPVAATAALVENVTALNAGLAPASLAYTQASAAFLGARSGVKVSDQYKANDGGNPCAGVAGGFFGCQPILLRLYIDLVKSFVIGQPSNLFS